MQTLMRELKFGSAEQLESIRLREAVLRVPLGLKFSYEELAAEENEHHLATLDQDGNVLGILLLKAVDPKVWKMRQVAVRPDMQGIGIGKDLVQFAEDYCRNEGVRTIRLHAREQVVSFYRALGYEVESDLFEEVGIPHFAMFKNLYEQEKPHRVTD